MTEHQFRDGILKHLNGAVKSLNILPADIGGKKFPNNFFTKVPEMRSIVGKQLATFFHCSGIPLQIFKLFFIRLCLPIKEATRNALIIPTDIIIMGVLRNV